MGIMKNIANFLRSLDGAQSAKPAPPHPQSSNSDSLDYEDLIHEHEGEERHIYDKIADLRERIEKKEADLRRKFAEYDQASSSAKSSYEVEIRSLNDDLENMNEELKTFASQLKKEKVFLQKLRHLRNSVGHKIDRKEIERVFRETERQIAKEEDEGDLLDELRDVQYPEHREGRTDREKNEVEKREDFQKIRAKIEPEKTKKNTQKRPDENSSEIEDIKKKINSL